MKKLLILILLCVSVPVLMPVQAHSATPPTLAQVASRVKAKQVLNRAEARTLAQASVAAVGGDAVVLEDFVLKYPQYASTLAVKVSTITNTTTAPAPLTAALSVACGSGQRTTSKTYYAKNVTNSTMWRFQVSKDFTWNSCVKRVNDDDFMSSDGIQGYVYGPFQFAWDDLGVTDHHGGYYNFSGQGSRSAHGSEATGKFKQCVGWPISICPSTVMPWVKNNAHYDGSVANYSGTR